MEKGLDLQTKEKSGDDIQAISSIIMQNYVEGGRKGDSEKLSQNSYN